MMNRRFEVAIAGLVRAHDHSDQDRRPSPEELESLLDTVFSELERLGLTDISIGARGLDGNWEISLDIEAASLEEASYLASTRVRAAFHAAGVHTKWWDADFLQSSAAAVDANSLLQI